MMTKSFSPPWSTVGTVPISGLFDTRLQLHWAAQIVASFGNAVIEPRADDSQSNLGWVEDLGALCSHPSTEGLSVALRLADLTLLFLDREEKVISEIRLQGKTLEQGFEWLASEYTEYSGKPSLRPFTLRDYEMPAHAVGQQAAFTCENLLALKEFRYWYANAHQVLHTLSGNWKQASPIRCWPHHFDIATLVVLDPDKGPEESTIGRLWNEPWGWNVCRTLLLRDSLALPGQINTSQHDCWNMAYRRLDWCDSDCLGSAWKWTGGNSS